MIFQRAPIALLLVVTAAFAPGCPSASKGSASPAGATSAATGQTTRITEHELDALSEQGALLLDVRTPEEFAAGHLEGAVNFPIQRMEAGEFPPDVRSARNVVVYCASGRRSARAANALIEHGVQQVYDLGAMPKR